MRSLLKSFFAALLFSLSTIQAQEVQLGFRLESNVFNISGSTGNYTSDALPTDLQINLAVYPIDKLAIEARLGAEGSKEYYEGAEYGLFARYYFIKYVYGITGLLVHNTINDSHNTWGQYAKTLVMPGIGIGFNPGNRIFFEAMYLFSGTVEAGYDLPIELNSRKVPTYMNQIWKFGFGFSLKLFSILGRSCG